MQNVYNFKKAGKFGELRIIMSNLKAISFSTSNFLENVCCLEQFIGINICHNAIQWTVVMIQLIPTEKVQAC